MAAPRLVSLALTTVQDAAVPFSNTPLWLIGGNFRVSTNALLIGAVPERDAAQVSYAASTDLSMQFVPLHQLLVAPAVAGQNGTLTMYGVVVDNLEDFVAAVYGSR
jgi:hypothetical protein